MIQFTNLVLQILLTTSFNMQMQEHHMQDTRDFSNKTRVDWLPKQDRRDFIEKSRVDWFRYEVFKDTQKKLYEPDLADQFDLDTTHQQIYLSDREMVEVMLGISDAELKDIEENLHRYRLVKSRSGEDSATPHKLSEVLTQSLQEITKDDRNLIMCAYLGIIKTGRIWGSFATEFNTARAFYAKKAKSAPSARDNLRCLINSNNLLKILQRFIKDNVLNRIFEAGLVDTDIHQAKKCRDVVSTVTNVSSGNQNRDDLVQVSFEKIAELGSRIHTPTHKTGATGFIMLDMSNAYNNVKYDFLAHVLKNYLPRIYTDEPDTQTTTADNLANGITRLIRLTKFWDPYIKEELKRNKGVPQGCPISADLYIICMDYIFREIIQRTTKDLDLKLGQDYKLQVYVDDILIEIISAHGFGQAPNLLTLMTEIFTSYHFKLNLVKSCATANLAVDLALPVITPSHKYLGIYMESDPKKYIELVEAEFTNRFPRNQKVHTFRAMEDNLDQVFKAKNGQPNHRVISMVRGKLNYRFTPFAKTNPERRIFLSRQGYPGLAEILWPDRSSE